MSDHELPAPPQSAREFFGAALPRITAYAQMLATDGVVRGLIGPREVPRLWERHLLNCAVIAELLGPGLAVVDVGSGAGLPGIVLAMVRPDLRVTLVEPLARRIAFLEECRDALELTTLAVVRGRAEEPATVSGAGGADVVTARAVAPLERLARWCLPLVREGGRLLAVKGESAEEEVARSRRSIERRGGGAVTVRRCGVGVIDPPATVVEVVRRARSATKGRSR
jgi:16S rRNA (guanine527-N7)-methyltransferase